MQSTLWIALGSALGGIARYWTGVLVSGLVAGTFPWGTLIINIVGSLIIGVFATLPGIEGRFAGGTIPREFITIGLCGGFTTFSSFSLQTLALMQEGAWIGAGLNILGSVALCLLGAWLGYSWAQSLLS
jgi:CrcB protein